MQMLRTAVNAGSLSECLLQPRQIRIEHDGAVASALELCPPHVRPQHEHQAVNGIAEGHRLDSRHERVRDHCRLTLAEVPVNQELVDDANITLNALIGGDTKEARALRHDNALSSLQVPPSTARQRMAD